MKKVVVLLALIACGDDDVGTTTDAMVSDASFRVDAIAVPDADIPLDYGERCGDAIDNDADDLVDEDCTTTLFSGVYAPGVSADPAPTAIEAATGRPLDVLQTYHSMTKLGIERTGPDLALIFGRGQVAHLNVEPSGYTAAQYANPTAAPIATDLAAMGEVIANVLDAHPNGRMLLTFGAEMNGSWTDWGCLTATQYKALYRAAYVELERQLMLAEVDPRRVRWAYGPDARGTGACATGLEYYPGHDIVDLVGLSAYRAGTESVTDAITTPMAALLDGMPAVWQQNRFVVLQTGSREPDRGAWVTSLYSQLTTDSRVAGVIYFDASADWTIPVDGPGWTAWTTAMAATPVADAQLDAIFLPHFWDVPYSTPEFPEIQALGDFGVTTGCGTAPPRFCPDDRLSRRDAAIWLARAFRLTISDSFPLYSDVLPDDPAFMEIQALAVAGFTMGCGGGRFCPDDDMTGGDFATMLLSIGAPVGAGVDRPLTRTEAAVILAPAAHIAPRPL